MKHTTLRPILVSLMALAAAHEARAQYIYLDANGNGVHDAGDRLNANGTPTTVEVWLSTDANRDGSPAAPDESNNPHTLFSYVVNLAATGGTVTYGAFTNEMPSMFINFIELDADGVNYKNGYGGTDFLDPGTYHLCTLIITGVSGTPKVDIVDMIPGSSDYTSFGTECWGHSWDNTYKLDGPNTRDYQGTGDFLDADGVVAAGASNPPSPEPGTGSAEAGSGEDDPSQCGGSCAARPPAWIFGLLALLLVAPRFRC